MTALDIRLCSASDLKGLGKVLDSIDLFPAEMLPELMSPFLGADPADLWLTCLSEESLAALCFARAERLTQGTWNMLALGVDAGFQGRGIGAALVAALEEQLRARGARIVIVDTSSTGHMKRPAPSMPATDTGKRRGSGISGPKATTRSPSARRFADGQDKGPGAVPARRVSKEALAPVAYTSGTSTSRLPTWLAADTTPCSSICSTRRAALL